MGARQGRRARVSIVALLLAQLLLVIAPARPGGAVALPEPPTINAAAAVVLSDFNQVLYGYNERARLPQASTTKIMTAIVAVRYGKLDMQVRVDQSDLVGESTMGLTANEVVTLRDLLYGMLLPSGNDAATAIARSIGWREGDQTPEQSIGRFIGLMNQTAQEYGLRDTRFVTPHGLDADGHFTTAYDLAITLRAALNYPIIRQIMQTISYNAAGHDLWNGNKLLQSRGDIIGGKTGFTEVAGFCLAAAAKRGNRFAIAVVLNDNGDNWFTDMSNLLDYGLALEEVTPLPKYVDPRLVGTQFNQSPGMFGTRP